MKKCPEGFFMIENSKMALKSLMGLLLHDIRRFAFITASSALDNPE
jgi:hypothetical protein